MNIFEKVKSLNLPLGKYVVFGSGPMAVHGIRENHDIDILAIPEVYEQLKLDSNWHEKTWPSGDICLEKEDFEITNKWKFDSYEPDIQKLIDEAEVINGVPFVKLEEVLAWKKVRGKEKDLKDIQLIEDYLKTNL